jgi:hypothetical protein
MGTALYYVFLLSTLIIHVHPLTVLQTTQPVHSEPSIVIQETGAGVLDEDVAAIQSLDSLDSVYPPDEGPASGTFEHQIMQDLQHAKDMVSEAIEHLQSGAVPPALLTDVGGEEITA